MERFTIELVEIRLQTARYFNLIKYIDRKKYQKSTVKGKMFLGEVFYLFSERFRKILELAENIRKSILIDFVKSNFSQISGNCQESLGIL